MLNDLPRPIIFAHRGASAYAPENTLAAFELALHQGVDAIELDAKLTRDGQVVVIHDQTVDRTTEGAGRVKDLTLSELRKLDAGSHFDVAYQGEKIPTLEEVFKAVGQLTFINVELTNYSSITDDLPDKVAAIVKRNKMSRRVLFSSFNPLALRRIHTLMPETPLGLLAYRGWKGYLACSWVGRLLVPYQSLHPESHEVTQRLIDKAHALDRKVVPYTVNQAEELISLFASGVDGVFTDDPPLALQIRSESVRKLSRSSEF